MKKGISIRSPIRISPHYERLVHDAEMDKPEQIKPTAKQRRENPRPSPCRYSSTTLLFSALTPFAPNVNHKNVCPALLQITPVTRFVLWNGSLAQLQVEPVAAGEGAGQFSTRSCGRTFCWSWDEHSASLQLLRRLSWRSTVSSPNSNCPCSDTGPRCYRIIILFPPRSESCWSSSHFPTRAVLLLYSFILWVTQARGGSCGHRQGSRRRVGSQPSSSAGAGSHHGSSARGSEAQPRDNAGYWCRDKEIYQEVQNHSFGAFFFLL